jgi:hypothetical protein
MHKEKKFTHAYIYSTVQFIYIYIYCTGNTIISNLFFVV